jgi:hypothetical protein
MTLSADGSKLYAAQDDARVMYICRPVEEFSDLTESVGRAGLTKPVGVHPISPQRDFANAWKRQLNSPL